MSEWQEIQNTNDVTDDASLLALFLCSHAGGEPVRSLEAIACTFLNSRKNAANVVEAISANAAQPPVLSLSSAQREKSMMIARRVARRALNGGLSDVTNGATSFHHIDQDPDWAKTASLVHSEGNYLFFTLNPSAKS